MQVQQQKRGSFTFTFAFIFTKVTSFWLINLKTLSKINVVSVTSIVNDVIYFAPLDFSKTTEPNELKFRVELDFSHTVAQKKFQVIQTKSP